MKGCWRIGYSKGLRAAPHILPTNYQEESVPLQWREMAFPTLTNFIQPELAYPSWSLIKLLLIARQPSMCWGWGLRRRILAKNP